MHGARGNGSVRARATLRVVLALLVAIGASPAQAAHAQIAIGVARVSRGDGGAQGEGASKFPSIASGGRFVAFQSDASTLVAGDGNGVTDVFVRDTVSGETTCASLATGGSTGDDVSCSPALSADGGRVVFESKATNLVPGDTNGSWDVFVYDAATRETTRVSTSADGVQGSGDSRSPAISADGRRVAFVAAAADLVPGDGNGCDDVFVKDLATGALERASLAENGAEADGPSAAPSIDASGCHVAFSSRAATLVAGDTAGMSDVFVRDLAGGHTVRVSVSGAGAQGNLDSWSPAISGDGSRVAFESLATNVVAGDGAGHRDVFVRDLHAGTTVRVSVSASGTDANGESKAAAISADGGLVAFSSTASNLVSGDTNGVSDVFVRESASGVTLRASVGPSGAQADGASYSPALSAEGGWLAFDSDAADLTAGDTNGCADAFSIRIAARRFERIAGDDRFETAVLASQRAFPGHADAVVLATGRNWPDALGGAALAGAAGGPVLLTERGALPEVVRQEIVRLAPHTVYVLGSTAAISGSVEDALHWLPSSPVVPRLGGVDRYGTAAAVTAEVVRLRGADFDGTVLVATGGNYPDALSASPIAAARCTPILLAPPAAASVTLPFGTARAFVLGSSNAVSGRIEDALVRALGRSKVGRLEGLNRYGTSAAVAAWGAGLGLGWDGVTLSTGENFPDALAGGRMAGSLGSVLLLTQTRSLPAEAAGAISAHAADIVTVRVLGKSGTVSDAVIGQTKAVLGE